MLAKCDATWAHFRIGRGTLKEFGGFLIAAFEFGLLREFLSLLARRIQGKGALGLLAHRDPIIASAGSQGGFDVSGKGGPFVVYRRPARVEGVFKIGIHQRLDVGWVGMPE